MVQTLVEVIEEFDPTKDYGIEIRKQYRMCLSVLKKGEKINPNEFIQNHLNKFTHGTKSFKTNREAVYHAFWIGKKIGILKSLPQEESGVYISFDDFCNLDSVSYFIDQLRESRYRNVTPGKGTGTRDAYAYRLWRFDRWLHGKTFSFNKEVMVGNNSYERTIENVTLEGVEHLLRLFQQPFKTESDFIKVVKKYLLDPMHAKKRAKTMKVDYNAIKSYFEKNDSPLNFRFDYNARYKTTNGEDEQPSLSLEDLINLLTVGKPSLVQKAVFLCKLHRGLDTSTMTDRFNFQTWSQLVKFFGTSDYKQWDLSKCPAPVVLTRMKTDYTHTGFLDRDAIEAIQKYLDYREYKTQSDMKEGEPLFLNDRNEPITRDWVNFSLRKLAKNAGLNKILQGYLVNKYQVNAHEFRDLLKSTLLDSGVRPDLADHFIGHKPKDSYEKQAILYPESMRKEYSKASKRLNLFSNLSSFIRGAESIDEMKEVIITLESDMAKISKRLEWAEKTRRKN